MSKRLALRQPFCMGPARIMSAFHVFHLPLGSAVSAAVNNPAAASSALYESSITSLPLLGRGKVRENYAVGDDKLLMVTTDRLSAFDVILGQPIPDKGKVLAQMSDFWFNKLRTSCRRTKRASHRKPWWPRMKSTRCAAAPS